MYSFCGHGRISAIDPNCPLASLHAVSPAGVSKVRQLAADERSGLHCPAHVTCITSRACSTLQPAALPLPCHAHQLACPCDVPRPPAPQVLDEGRNHASTFLGTPLYLSPEMCNVGAAPLGQHWVHAPSLWDAGSLPGCLCAAHAL